MDLELIRTFLELERTRHFKRTAEALFITQAAVSARIKQLESILGVVLFDRSRRDIKLTSDGARLIQHADRLMQGWRQARQDVGLQEIDEQLVIGGSLRLWNTVLQYWVERLIRHMPKLGVIAEAHSSDVLIRRLVDGFIDMAIISEPPQIELLRTEEITKLSLRLVSSEPNIEVKDALSTRYIMVDWGYSFALRHRQLYPDSPEARIRVDLGNMALSIILNHGGSAYLPEHMVAEHVLNDRLYFVEEAISIDRNVYAVFFTRSSKLPLLLNLIKLFQQK
jgi:DNA-binding transcriptional LysR family regulator